MAASAAISKRIMSISRAKSYCPTVRAGRALFQFERRVAVRQDDAPDLGRLAGEGEVKKAADGTSEVALRQGGAHHQFGQLHRLGGRETAAVFRFRRARRRGGSPGGTSPGGRLASRSTDDHGI